VYRDPNCGRESPDPGCDLATTRRLFHIGTEQGLDRSLLLAVEALWAENILGARDSLYKALPDRPELTSFLCINEGDLQSVAFSPDGKTITAGYGGGDVVLGNVCAIRPSVKLFHAK
jgi:hypothetical protein